MWRFATYLLLMVVCAGFVCAPPLIRGANVSRVVVQQQMEMPNSQGTSGELSVMIFIGLGIVSLMLLALYLRMRFGAGT